MHRLILVVAIVCGLVQVVLFTRPLFTGSIAAGHDVGAHVIRLQLYTTALQEKQFPVRWVEWVREGNGNPQFQFYPPLFYAFSSMFVLFGVSLVSSIGMVIAVAFVIGWAGCVVIGKLQGNTLAGIVAATVFSWLPYRLSQVFVRAAYPEYMATAAFPWILIAISLLWCKKPRWGIALLALLVPFVLLTHQPSIFLVAPMAVLWIWYEMWQSKNLSPLKWLFSGLGIGLLLSATFTLPMLAERSFVHPEKLTAGYYDFHQHMLGWKQLTAVSWGYGRSQMGLNDGMSFQIGIAGLIALVAGILVAYIDKAKRLPVVIALTASLSGIWLMLHASLLWWERLAVLAYIQYPWRYIVLVVLGCSVVSLFVVHTLIRRLILPVAIVVSLCCMVGVIALSWGYRQPAAYLDANHFELSHLRSLPIEQQQDPSFGLEPGYVPVSVTQLGQIANLVPIEVLSGLAEIETLPSTMINHQFKATITQDALIRVAVHMYPGWRVSADNGSGQGPQPVQMNTENEQGYMDLFLPKGTYTVHVYLASTPIREFADAISLFTALGCVGVLVWQGIVRLQSNQRPQRAVGRHLK